LFQEDLHPYTIDRDGIGSSIERAGIYTKNLRVRRR
jgi:hypothetical protein